jgi:hypothetical protein
MDYIKPLELGMTHCLHICYSLGLVEGRLTRLCFSKDKKVIFCWFKSMLMTSSLGLQTEICVLVLRS